MASSCRHVLRPVVRHKGAPSAQRTERLSFFTGRFGLPNVGFMHGKVKTNNAVTALPRDFRKAVGRA